MRVRQPLIVCTLILALACPAQAQSDRVGAERIGGMDRYETAVMILIRAHHDFCREAAQRGTLEPGLTEEKCRDGAVASDWTLARGDSFADALAASSMGLGNDIMITPRDALPPAIEQLRDRMVNSAYVIGQSDVIDPSIDQALFDGYANRVERLAGDNRYLTAIEVAKFNRHISSESSSPFTDLIIANGDDWPDGLTASALAGSNRVVLLTQRDRLPDPVADYIGGVGGGETMTVVGGTAAVSDEVVAELEGLTGIPVRRLGGADRTETARIVADTYLAQDFGEPAPLRFGVLIIRPDSFADAITAPNLIHSRHAPILIAQTPDDLGQANIDWLVANSDRIETITGLGSADVLADRVLDQAEQAVCEGNRNC